MKRPLTAALILGALNAAVAVLALAIVELATPNEFGWYAYAPLNEVVLDPRFPWQYVVVPLSLLAANVLAGTVYLRRVLSR